MSAGFAVQQVGDGRHSWLRATYREELVVLDALYHPWTAPALVAALAAEDRAARRDGLPTRAAVEAHLWRGAALCKGLAVLWGIDPGSDMISCVAAGPHTQLAYVRRGVLVYATCLPCQVAILRPAQLTSGAAAEQWAAIMRAFTATHPVGPPGA